MKLEGLKINFLGDSITEGTGVSDKENIYWKRLARDYGLKEARGYGIGGTRIARQQNPSQMARHDLDFCLRYSEMDNDADVVVVFGGTNDFGHGDAPLGKMEDRDPSTFYGACHTLFSGLINKFPSAEIVIMTPLHRASEDEPFRVGATNPRATNLAGYVAIIKEVATYYSLPVLDLWSCSRIQPRVEILREKYCPDGLHPNDEGHAIIARRLAGFLKTL